MKKKSSFWSAVLQIILLDIIFSIDSVITAIGLSNKLFIIILAMVFSSVILAYCLNFISKFIDHHTSVKILALSFLNLVGFVLFLEAFDIYMPKGYLYFSTAFCSIVEVINILSNQSSAYKNNFKNLRR